MVLGLVVGSCRVTLCVSLSYVHRPTGTGAGTGAGTGSGTGGLFLCLRSRHERITYIHNMYMYMYMYMCMGPCTHEHMLIPDSDTCITNQTRNRIEKTMANGVSLA